MAELFGFTIQRAIKDKGGERTFSTPTPDDGTIDVAGGGFFGQVLDTDGRERSDLDLIRRYRDIAQQSECDTAIEDIVNEGIVSNQNDQAVEVSLDRLRYPDKIKRKIRKEFDEVLRLLHFEQKGHDIFRRWYVDGKLFIVEYNGGRVSVFNQLPTGPDIKPDWALGTSDPSINPYYANWIIQNGVPASNGVSAHWLAPGPHAAPCRRANAKPPPLGPLVWRAFGSVPATLEPRLHG